MLNVHSAGYVSYESALPQAKEPFMKKLKMIGKIFIDFIHVILLTLIVLLKESIYIFIPKQKKNIAGQTALITGAGNGIGKSLAECFAKKGCNVIIADIDYEAALSTAKSLEQYGVKIVAFKVDVANYSALLELQTNLLKDNLSVDILVNNAGLMPLLSLREGLPEDIERIAKTNLFANFWTARIFLPEMIRKRRGHIITISSMSALHPLPGAVVYTSTKFAVTGLTKALEEELRQEGVDYINFTIAYPYFVSTRKDLMKSLNLRFPAITAETTAKAILNAILQNSRKVVIPFYDLYLLSLVWILPYKVQCLIRDIFLRERESRVIKNPQEYISSKLYF